jgi:hypothetical protein
VQLHNLLQCKAIYLYHDARKIYLNKFEKKDERIEEENPPQSHQMGKDVDNIKRTVNKETMLGEMTLAEQTEEIKYELMNQTENREEMAEL